MRRADVEDLYPLSPQQQGMLFGSLLAPGPGRYIEQEHHTLPRGLDERRFRDAWDLMLERHAVLRTAYVWRNQEQPVQVVLRRARVPLEHHDWRGVARSPRAERLNALLARDRERGFDLGRAPQMRLTLLRTDDGHEFVWTLHHIVMDGWSRPLLVREFGALYAALCRGHRPDLARPRPYRDYIAWLRRQDLAAAEAFWSSALSGFTAPTALGRADGRVEAAVGAYASHELRLSAASTAALQDFARRRRVTISTVLHGVWALLLSRYSGEADVVFGTTVSGRPPDLEGAETMIGLFINTLPFRVAVPPAAQLAEWLELLQARHVELRRFEHCSAGQIHQWSGLRASAQLYESLLVVENYPADAGRPRGGAPPAAHARFIGAQTAHALTILCAQGEELLIRIVHDQRRVGDRSAGHILQHFVDVLMAMPADPEQSLGGLMARIRADDVPYVTDQAGAASPRSRPYVAPRTETEQVVSRLWSEVLGLDRVGVHDNFLELGGHSLIATQLMSRLRGAFQVELPLRVLFDSADVAELAATVEDVLLREIEQMPEGEAERLLAEQASRGTGAP